MRKRGIWVLGGFAVVAFGTVSFVSRDRRASESRSHGTDVRAEVSDAIGKFEPTVPNPAASPSHNPPGMVWIPGGEFSMGAQDPPDINDEVGMNATQDSRPIHRVYVDGFWMDSTDVTNREFAEFVNATGYVTVAERTPKAEDFPDAPPENLVAGSSGCRQLLSGKLFDGSLRHAADYEPFGGRLR